MRSARVPKSYPLRVIRDLANEALAALAGEFSTLHASAGRPSIPPEKLLRAMLLQAFYSIRSERLLMEQASRRIHAPKCITPSSFYNSVLQRRRSSKRVLKNILLRTVL
ncbi:transposase [Methylocystis sp. IM3]|uniref:transposase n=1 Tax=unclassified Methylocystis TaxID=2625913 RepID=UPI00405349D8